MITNLTRKRFETLSDIYIYDKERCRFSIAEKIYYADYMYDLNVNMR